MTWSDRLGQLDCWWQDPAFAQREAEGSRIEVQLYATSYQRERVSDKVPEMP